MIDPANTALDECSAGRAVCLVLGDPRAETVIPVRQSQFLIGTSAQCHLRLNGDGVDALQCAVVARSGRCFLRNFNREAGTWVGRRQLRGEWELRDRDWLQVGTLRLTVRIGESQAPSLPTVRFDAIVTVPAPVPAPPPVPPAPRRARQTLILRKADLLPETNVVIPVAAPVAPAAPIRPTVLAPRSAPMQAASVVPTPSAPAAPALPAPRRTKPTLIQKKPEPQQDPDDCVDLGEILGDSETEAPTPPIQPVAVTPRKSRVTQVELNVPPPETIVDAGPSRPASAELPSVSASPAGNPSRAEPPGSRAALPGYAMAWKKDKEDDEARPVMRLVVGRKDQAQPMLRKWEMEAAQVAAQQSPSRRRSSGFRSRLLLVGVLALMVVSLGGGFYLGRPRMARAKQPNPFVITIEAWNRLSEADQQDPIYRDMLEKPAGAPNAPGVEADPARPPQQAPKADPHL